MSLRSLPLPPTAPLACDTIQPRLSDYLDGAVTGIEMRSIADHLSTCAACTAELARAQTLQRALAQLGPARAPADLNLRLRVAISHERNRGWRRELDTLTLRWQNGLRALVLQAAGGLAATVLLLAGILSLLGTVGSTAVLANDEPLGAMTAPHYLYSVSGIQPIVTPHDETLVVEASVNAAGQAYDFRILSGPQDLTVRRQVSNRLLTSVFRPASVFGVPIRGHLLLTFSGISVHS